MTAATHEFDVSEAESFILRNARAIGHGIVFHALKLWHTIEAPETPWMVKAPLVAALVYLGCPVDAVPDVVPLVGFSDDAAVVSGALAAAHLYITDEIVAKAEASTRRIFG